VLLVARASNKHSSTTQQDPAGKLYYCARREGETTGKKKDKKKEVFHPSIRQTVHPPPRISLHLCYSEASLIYLKTWGGVKNDNSIKKTS